MSSPSNSADVEAVRRFYQGATSGDLDAAVAECDPEVEYVNPPEALEGGVRHGHAGMREALEQLRDAFADVQAEILSIDTAGPDRIVVEANVVGHGRESGIPITLGGGHVFTLRHGKIARFEWFTNVSHARAALTSEQPRPDE